MTDTSGYLSPEEIAAFQTRRNTVNDQYSTGLSNLTFGKSQAYQDYVLGNKQLAQTWGRAFQGLASPLARRGLGDSGIYQQAIQNYYQDRQNAMNNASMLFDRNLKSLNLQGLNLEGSRQSSLSSIDAEEAARRASVAATIRSVQ